MMSLRHLTRGSVPRHACDVTEFSPALAQFLRGFAAAPSNQMALIKQLREQSGAPVSEVKAALQQANWDMGKFFSLTSTTNSMQLKPTPTYPTTSNHTSHPYTNADKANQELRNKGLAAAGKKSSRRAAEGLIALAKSPNGGAAVVEINSETDFVARNPQFMELATSVAAAALKLDQQQPSSTSSTNNNFTLDIDTLRSTQLENGTSVEQAVTDMASVVRENIKLRRAYGVSCTGGDAAANVVVGSYLHAGVGPGTGRIAALLALQPTGGGLDESMRSGVQELANKLAMHVVGAVPKYLNPTSVLSEALEAEKSILREQASRTGKPPAIVEKMVEGRLRKYYEEVCLLEQPFIMDDKQKVHEVVAGFNKDSPIEIVGFVRVQVGEGLEEEGRKNFADEVAETLQQF